MKHKLWAGIVVAVSLLFYFSGSCLLHRLELWKLQSMSGLSYWLYDHLLVYALFGLLQVSLMRRLRQAKAPAYALLLTFVQFLLMLVLMEIAFQAYFPYSESLDGLVGLTLLPLLFSGWDILRPEKI